MRNGHLALSEVRIEANKFNVLRERLRQEFPEIDEETLSDTLEGITDIKEMLALIIRSALDDEALCIGISTRLSDLKSRHERIDRSAKFKRQLALQAMTDADIPKLAEADFTASLKQGAPSIEILTEEKIPAAYWKPQPSKLDKLGILAALKTGTEIDGASLVAARMQLAVRTK